MGRPAGGSDLARGLDELRLALYDYYGALNEVKTLSESNPSSVATVKVPEKPEALVLWEECQALELPLVSGGLIDQPHIWLEEVHVVIEITDLFPSLK